MYSLSFLNQFLVKEVVHSSPVAKHKPQLERNIKRTEIPTTAFVLETTDVPACHKSVRSLTCDCVGHATRARSVRSVS